MSLKGRQATHYISDEYEDIEMIVTKVMQIKSVLVAMRGMTEMKDIARAEEVIVGLTAHLEMELDIERTKSKKVLDYCKGKTTTPWAAKVVSILIDCEYKDSEAKLKEMQRRSNESIQTGDGHDTKNQMEQDS